MASIKEQEHYQRVGRLRKPIADSIGRKAADIYVSENHLMHIQLEHGAQLATMGLTPMSLIGIVLGDFNRVYKGSGHSLLLVVYGEKAKLIAVELNFAFRREFYEVKTAFIASLRFLRDDKLLWKK